MSHRPAFSLGLLLSMLLLTGNHAFAQAAGFLRGDATGNGKVDISDPLFTLGVLFARKQKPVCWDTADSNDDAEVDVSDPIYTLLFLFAGGNPPPPPFPNCGVDPTADDLDCTSFPPCISPDPPTELVASSGPGAGEITLQWSPSSTAGIRGYEVFTSTSPDDPNPERVTAEPVSQTSFTDAGLEPRTTYYYSVRAVGQIGNVSSFSSEASATALLPGSSPELRLDVEGAAVPGGTLVVEATVTAVVDMDETFSVGFDVPPGVEVLSGSVAAFGALAAGESRSVEVTLGLPDDPFYHVIIAYAGGGVPEERELDDDGVEEWIEINPDGPRRVANSEDEEEAAIGLTLVADGPLRPQAQVEVSLTAEPPELDVDVWLEVVLPDGWTVLSGTTVVGPVRPGFDGTVALMLSVALPADAGPIEILATASVGEPGTPSYLGGSSIILGDAP